jgi:hypothetical protein
MEYFKAPSTSFGLKRLFGRTVISFALQAMPVPIPFEDTFKSKAKSIHPSDTALL